jgi:hypothetical protein
MTKLEELAAMLESGAFHHATYRDMGTLWEGLYIYQRDDNGFNGFKIAMAFQKGSPELAIAEKLTARTGVSVGAYGCG